MVGGRIRGSGPNAGVIKPRRVAKTKVVGKKATSAAVSAAKGPSKQKAAWAAYQRERLLKDLPKWAAKWSAKEDMHKRLQTVFKSHPDLGGDRDLINCITDHYTPVYWTGLDFANDELRNDFDIVMRAVRKGSDDFGSKAGNALGRASARLQDDKKVVLAAIQVSGFAIFHASDRLLADAHLQNTALANLKKQVEADRTKHEVALFRSLLAKFKRGQKTTREADMESYLAGFSG